MNLDKPLYKDLGFLGGVFLAILLVGTIVFFSMKIAEFDNRNTGPTFEQKCDKLGGVTAEYNHGKGATDLFCIKGDRVIKRG